MWEIRGVIVPPGDLNQRYGNSFIEVSIAGGPAEIVKLDDFTGNRIYLNDGRTPVYGDVKLLREFPQLGAVEFKGVVHFLSRRPSRQWSRGLSTAVLFDYCRVRTEAQFSARLNKDRANAAFYPHYTPWKEGFENIKKEEVASFAHNRKFWFSGNKRAIYLWYEEVPVGEMKDETLFFNSECRLLKQEVTDEFRNAFNVV